MTPIILAGHDHSLARGVGLRQTGRICLTAWLTRPGDLTDHLTLLMRTNPASLPPFQISKKSLPKFQSAGTLSLGLPRPK
ncbi:MAG TPA: hypothetical protein VEK33_16380 [Terriglobales bacterium]|nr:hypothetical protein [Terriglobales bacterium]